MPAARRRAPKYGLSCGGKTGYGAQEENGHYSSDRYIASFVGLAPASNPRLIVAVMIDEPSNGQYYGGAVAAPVFSQVMSGALRLLAVPLMRRPAISCRWKSPRSEGGGVNPAVSHQPSADSFLASAGCGA